MPTPQMKVSIKAIEFYLPSKIENGNDLKRDNADWRIDDIENKTGIFNRHIAEPEQTATDMAVVASEQLFKSGVRKEDIDFLILVTQSPDYLLPSSACILQDRLRLRESTIAFDINLGCSGFIYGLAVGSSLIETGLAKKGLLVCADTYTKYIDKHDRTCRPIFSDGASTTLLASSDQQAMGSFELGTDGSGFNNIILPSSGTRECDKGSRKKDFFMDGAKVFMFTMAMVPKCLNSIIKKSDKTLDDIYMFFFHQASKTVMDSIIRRLKLPKEKVFINYDKIGNTVSASIPIALKNASDEKRLQKGAQIMLVGFGVGCSWGGCILKWDGET